MDELLIFSTYFREIPDFNDSDELVEMKHLLARQSMLLECLEGSEPIETLLDLLETQDINPIDYVETVEANVEFAMNSGLILPGSVEWYGTLNC
jgi:hypothetical protein